MLATRYGLPFFSHHHLTETVSIQQLSNLCGCGINIVSSLGSLGHAKVVKVITYLCGCQGDWSQTIYFLCISTQLLWLIGWVIVISSGGQRQPMADSRQKAKLLPHVSRFSLYSKLDMMWIWTRSQACACGFLLVYTNQYTMHASCIKHLTW